MAINLTLGECVTAHPALQRIASQAWPVKTAYRMGKLLKLLQAEVTIFEEQRASLVKEYGTARSATPEERTRGADPEVYQVPADKLAEYLARFRDLRDLPIAIEWMPLTLDAMSGDGQCVSGVDLADLGPLLADAPDPAAG